ncbi:MAG: hypothetical protein LKJ36_00575 [Lactobacillus sp.]|nr:hypothetical protein [Lactobacillus sp.]MCI1973261.1 hypothetical protein [Lactobacillus sp.]
MIEIPEILIDVIEFSKDGEIKLKGSATLEQQKAFKEFMKELNSRDCCMEFEDTFDKIKK